MNNLDRSHPAMRWAATVVWLALLVLPAHANVHQSEAWAQTRFVNAGRMREALNGRPAKDRGRREYEKVIAAYRAIYYGAPTSTKADPSVVAVAELADARGDHAFAMQLRDTLLRRSEAPEGGAVRALIDWTRSCDSGLPLTALLEIAQIIIPELSPAELEAAVCELRRAHRKWGPKRLVFEMGRRGLGSVTRSTVYRVLVRNQLIEPRSRRRRRRDYMRWERPVPMQLWQLDVTASAFLADGREVKIVTGIDDHSRYCVIARAVMRATARPVCRAFVEAMAIPHRTAPPISRSRA